MGPLVALITECAAGRVVLLFCMGLTMKPVKGAQLGEDQQRRYPAGEALGEMESQHDELGMSEGARSCEPSGSGAVVVVVTSSLCSAEMASASFM